MKTEPQKIGRNKHTKSIIPKHRISMKSGFIRKIPSLKVSKVDNSRWKIAFQLLDQTEKKVQHFLSFPEKTSNNFKGFDVGSVNEFLPVKVPALLEASVVNKKVLLRENRAKRSSKLISNFGTISSTSHERFPSSRYLRERPARDILNEFYRNAFFNYKNQIGAILKKCVICSERTSSRLLKGKGSLIQQFHKLTNKSKVGESITHYGTIGACAVTKFKSIKRPKNTKLSIKLSNTNENTHLNKSPVSSKKSETFPLSSEYSVINCGPGNRDFRMIFKKIFPSLNLSEGSVTHASSDKKRQSQHRHVEKTPSKMPNDGGPLESAFTYKIPSVKVSKGDGNIWKVIQGRPSEQAASEMEGFLGFSEKESNTLTRFGAASEKELSSVKVPTLLETSVLDEKVLSCENSEKQSPKLIYNYGTAASIKNDHSLSDGKSQEKLNRKVITEFYGSDFCNVKIPMEVALKRCVVALERAPSPLEDRRIVTQAFHTFNTKPISSKSGESSSSGICDKSAVSEFNNMSRPKHTESLSKLSNKAERIHVGEKPVSFKQSIHLPSSSENSVQQSNKDSKILCKVKFPFLNLSEQLVTDAGFTDSRQSQNIERSKCTSSIIPEDGNNIESSLVCKIPSITISKAGDNIWRVLQHRPSDPAVSGLEGFLPFSESGSNTNEECSVASVNEVSFERVPKVLAALGLGRKVVPRENVEERSLKLTSSLDNEASNKGKESHRQSASRHSNERSDRDLKTENYENNNKKTPNEVTPPSKRKSVPSLSKKDTYLERRNSNKIKSALEMHNMNPKSSKIINDSKSDREMEEILSTMFFWRA